MLLLQPQKILIPQDELDEINEDRKLIYRMLTFNRNTSSRTLLKKFINSTNSLAELLSIKNAQMEAHDDDEAKVYLKNLNRAILFVVGEIRKNKNFEHQTQLFQLFRLISPEAHEIHPNRYRHTQVQIGAHICPTPKEIVFLVQQIFLNMEAIDHPLIRAIYFHHELIRVHPFVDGNGRITRIAKNWMLMYELYPPIFIKDDSEKFEYIHTLSQSFNQLHKNGGGWNDDTSSFFLQEISRIKRSMKLIIDDLQR